MLLPMVAFVQVCFAGILLNGMGGLVVCVIVYLHFRRLELREHRQARKDLEQRSGHG